MTEFTNKFLDISHLIKSEFDRNVALHGDKIKCRRGCSQCCYQIFRITFMDSFIIRQYLSTLELDKRNLLKEKAKSYLSLKENVKNNEEYSKTPGTVPCPALGKEGECMIYEARPVICRRFGPPVYDYKNPSKIFACELNFSDGEEINDPELIARQTSIGKKWDELKTEFNIAYGINENASTTIAEAIFSDKL